MPLQALAGTKDGSQQVNRTETDRIRASGTKLMRMLSLSFNTTANLSTLLNYSVLQFLPLLCEINSTIHVKPFIVSFTCCLLGVMVICISRMTEGLLGFGVHPDAPTENLTDKSDLSCCDVKFLQDPPLWLSSIFQT